MLVVCEFTFQSVTRLFVHPNNIVESFPWIDFGSWVNTEKNKVLCIYITNNNDISYISYLESLSEEL